MAGNIPTLAQLSQFDVNRPDQQEAVAASLYDSVAYAQAGQTQLQFFQIPKGQLSKTNADTNMTVAGMLPAPQSFLIQTVELYFFAGAVITATGATATGNYTNDVHLFYKSLAFLDLTIGSKSYLTEAPLQKFPPRCGLTGWAALSDSTTAGANQRTVINYAANAGPVYEMNPPILLTPTQNFNLSLNWPAAVALSVAGTVFAQFSGVLYRNSQ